jgi:hypothetical protein
MGLYNFDPRFVPSIKAGTTTHTIRRVRPHPDKPGNTLHLYMGLRTRSVELIMRVPCVSVQDIRIGRRPHTVHIDGELLSPDECELFARQDGFDSFTEMMEYWRGRLPFEGHLIRWKYPEGKQ